MYKLRDMKRKWREDQYWREGRRRLNDIIEKETIEADIFCMMEDDIQ